MRSIQHTSPRFPKPKMMSRSHTRFEKRPMKIFPSCNNSTIVARALALYGAEYPTLTGVMNSRDGKCNRIGAGHPASRLSLIRREMRKDTSSCRPYVGGKDSTYGASMSLLVLLYKLCCHRSCVHCRHTAIRYPQGDQIPIRSARSTSPLAATPHSMR